MLRLSVSRVFFCLTLCGLVLLPLFGCAKEESPKPQGGGTYYTGPMHKGNSGKQADETK